MAIHLQQLDQDWTFLSFVNHLSVMRSLLDDMALYGDLILKAPTKHVLGVANWNVR